LFYLIIEKRKHFNFEKAIKNWVEEHEDYWVNNVTNYVVRDWSSSMRKEWVILDNNGMMISCEWRNNKKNCMNEADYE